MNTRLLVLFITIVFSYSLNASNNKQLHKLFEDDWRRSLEASPEIASYFGEEGYDHLWNKVHPKDFVLILAQQRASLSDLKKIKAHRLSDEDKISHALAIRNLETSIKGLEVGAHYFTYDHQWGVQNLNEITDTITFDSPKDYENWIKRLESFGSYLDDIIALQQEGLSKGISHPRVVVDRIVSQITELVSKTNEKSPFFKPFKTRVNQIDEKTFNILKTKALSAIEKTVLPALKNYNQFLLNTYRPKAPTGVGLWQLESGNKLYSYFANHHTTTNKSPDEIHELGLSEVSRIRKEMEKVKQQVNFKGSLTEFFHFLRTDKKFFFNSSKELLKSYRALAKEIDPKVVTLFGNIPRMPYGITPIPEESAPNSPTAYYMGPAADGSRAGFYYVNLNKPQSRPSWEMVALTLHEAVPGHHFQIALAQELKELPKFRRLDGATAYIEGWGLYAEFLGEEMGLYKDPFDKFGQLSYEMWRSIRLVVDTGIHSKKWTRDQAIKYFLENSPRTKHDITNEVDRYIASPGQALAYKIGQLKILELRRKAETALKDRFNVKAFHDQILGSGALPLDVLETKIQSWIDSQI